MATSIVNAATVDGVPAFVVHREPDELQQVAVLFRLGLCDQTLTTTGTVELLAHYALEWDLPASVSASITIGPLITSIGLAAPPHLLPGVLDEVFARLRDPDPAVLAEFAAAMAQDPPVPPGPLDEALLNRYGARGPGLSAYADAGLPAFDPAQALVMANWAFTRGNLAVVADADLPEGIRIDLPTGSLVPSFDPVPAESRYPVGYPHSSDTDVIVTALVPSHPASTIAQTILTKRITNSLRHRLGMVYSPSGVNVVFAGVRVTGFRTDVPVGTTGAVVAQIFDDIVTLAHEGPTAHELAEAQRDQLRVLEDEDAGLAIATVQAEQFLTGLMPQSLTQMRYSRLSVTREQVRLVVDAMIDSFMLGVPAETPMAVAALNWDGGPVDPQPLGEALRAKPGTQGRGLPAQTVVLTDDGRLFTGGETGLIIDLGKVEAMVAWPDGRRRLIRSDGYSLTIEPQLWWNGARVVRKIDQQVPSDKIIPAPARELEEIPQPAGAFERILLRLADRATLIWLGAAIAIVLIVVIFQATVTLIFPVAMWIAALVIWGTGFSQVKSVPEVVPPGPRLERRSAKVRPSGTGEAQP